jgi:hypothetical protein
VWNSAGQSSIATAIIEVGAGPDYAILKGESGFVIVTPLGAFEWNAVVSVVLGFAAALVSFSNRRIPVLTPKRLQVIAVILLVLGLGFYLF